jgi:hypothetical protein
MLYIKLELEPETGTNTFPKVGTGTGTGTTIYHYGFTTLICETYKSDKIAKTLNISQEVIKLPTFNRNAPSLTGSACFSPV